MADSVNPQPAPPRPTKARRFLSKAIDILLWVGVAVALFLVFGRRSEGISTGSEAPQISLALVDSGVESGKSISIPGKLERPLVLKAFASWCGACKKAAWYDDPTEARQAGKVDIIGVSVDETAAAALQAKEEWPITFPVVHDANGAFGQGYQVRMLPTYILIGTDGKIKRVTSGLPTPMDMKAWAEAQ